jgi:hypothetical protein
LLDRSATAERWTITNCKFALLRRRVQLRSVRHRAALGEGLPRSTTMRRYKTTIVQCIGRQNTSSAYPSPIMLSRAFVSVLCLAVAASGSLVLHDSRPTPPHGFVHHGAAPTHQMLTLRVGLASANMSGLEATLQRISNPASPEYGQYVCRRVHDVLLRC